MKNDILLLDADIIAFKLASTSQASYNFPGLETPAVALDDWELQPARIDEAVSKLRAQLKTDHVIVCLSCPTSENWRLGVLPSYKANRDYSKRPVYLSKIKDYLADNYPSYRRPTLEADDIMGILSTMQGLPPSLLKGYPEFPKDGRKIIVSEDKDMKTVPGWLYNPAKDSSVKLIEEADAEYFHMFQTLVGDPTDGYKGCPGVGKVWAKKSMDTVVASGASLWELVVKWFEDKGLTESDALVQARVSRICRATDYDFKNKEVILWNPS